MEINTKNLVFLASLTMFVAVAPLQARRTHLKTFPFYEGASSHSGILPYGRTPQQVAEYERVEQAKDKHSNQLQELGEYLLAEGHFLAAELNFREALAVQPGLPAPYVGLAEALDEQGKTREALAAYQTLLFPSPNGILCSVADEVRTQMGYAIVLSELGQWPEAVAIYEKALPSTTHFGDAPLIDVHFSPRVPRPTQLQALAHIATGLQYTGTGEDKRAYVQFYQAIHLDADSAFANYYYGYGWNHLDPKDKVRVINAQQARAALQKAVKIGNADVKRAAAKALAAMEDAPKAAKKPA